MFSCLLKVLPGTMQHVQMLQQAQLHRAALTAAQQQQPPQQQAAAPRQPQTAMVRLQVLPVQHLLPHDAAALHLAPAVQCAAWQPFHC